MVRPAKHDPIAVDFERSLACAPPRPHNHHRHPLLGALAFALLLLLLALTQRVLERAAPLEHERVFPVAP